MVIPHYMEDRHWENAFQPNLRNGGGNTSGNRGFVLRVETYYEESNETKIRSNLDLLEEVREKAHLHQIIHQQTTARHFNDKVKLRSLQVGDFVLRLNQLRVEARKENSRNHGKARTKFQTLWVRGLTKSEQKRERRQGLIQSPRSPNPGAVEVHQVDSTTLDRELDSPVLAVRHARPLGFHPRSEPPPSPASSFIKVDHLFVFSSLFRLAI
ncbi:Rve domain-containing protein [Quillaja saponaria]|uniref:Rve domain-containing protein n=1 Tax=Quillaja saponaria TaxID=32244 RepID=A0AAD7VE92_QUISA|nr:Rve domain-containing protein [Quillaja saponaria]